jgi:hypothetical protein
MNNRKETPSFVKYHTGLSLFFSPAEMVFALQMANYEHMKSVGYWIRFSKAEYARRMGMKSYTFEQCVRRFISLGLLAKKCNALGNQVFYAFNMELYGKLIRIVAQTSDTDRLAAFFDGLKRDSRTVESISEEEIRALKD